MNRERSPNDLAAEIVRLRGNGPLPQKYQDKARVVAALWMEQDAHRLFMKNAPREAWDAICHEYVVTGFRPTERWPVQESTAAAG